MYVKIENVVGVHVDGYILEGREFCWERIENKKAAEEMVSEMDTGDYGLYGDVESISLRLVLDGTTILLERGDVYVMNDSGKTIDSIHA